MPMHPSPIAETVNPPLPSCRTLMRPPPFENISTLHHVPTARISGNDRQIRPWGAAKHVLSGSPLESAGGMAISGGGQAIIYERMESASSAWNLRASRFALEGRGRILAASSNDRSAGENGQ